MRSILMGLLIAFSTAAPTWAQTSAVSPLALSAASPELPQTDVGRDGWLLKVAMKHGVTGRLTEGVVNPNPFTSDRLEPGQYMYAVPLSGIGSVNELTWCAPKIKRSYGYTNWFAVCLMPMRHGVAWFDTIDGLYVQQLSIAGIPATLPSMPAIERQETAFSVVPEIEYRLIEWDRDDLDVRVYISGQGARSRPLGDFNLQRESDGSVRLETAGGAVKITQIGTDRRAARVEALTPMSANQPLRLPVSRY